MTSVTHGTMDPEAEQRLRQALIDHFYAHQIPFLYGYSHEVFLASEGGARDIAEHLGGRLQKFRTDLVPWIGQHMDLRGAAVLEIGAGTGSSTVALAEHGARVDAVDVDPEVLKVAELRCALHGVGGVRFIAANGADIPGIAGKLEYDLIIFFASLEHMTYPERLKALAGAWDTLRAGGLVSIFETPNRLWYADGHTSLMNFFHWLPDDVALDYSRFSRREGFNAAFPDGSRGPADSERLARWGRGVSYHEVEIAVRPIETLDVLASMNAFCRARDPQLGAYWPASIEGRFAALVQEIEPRIPAAFCEPSLDLLIRKEDGVAPPGSGVRRGPVSGSVRENGAPEVPVDAPNTGTRAPGGGPTGDAGTVDPAVQVAALRRRLADTESKLGEQEHRLQYLTHHASYRLASWLRMTSAWNVMRWMKTRNEGVVRVRALGAASPRALGCEVWLLAARPAPDAPAVPWEGFERTANRWVQERRPEAPYGAVLWTTKGTVRLPLYGNDPVLTFQRGPRCGKVMIEYDHQQHLMDLYADEAAPLEVHLRALGVPAGDAGPVPGTDRPATGPVSPLGRDRYSERERQWIEEMRSGDVRVLAIHTPRWVGVSSSTRTLFEHCYPFPASAAVEPYAIAPAEVRRQAALIAESGVKHVVCSGGDEIHHQLVRELKRLDDGMRCDLLWHGSPMQFGEDYTWRVIRQWIDAGREGVVHTIGTVKQGMEELFQRLGCRSRFVMNYVPEVPAGPSVPDPGGPYLGLWLSGQAPWKLPYPMLAAAALIPGSTVRTANLGPRAAEVVECFELPSDLRVERILPPDDLREAMRRTHLTLYVTFSECCPMLPLESLSVGTPCLTGPTSHLFEDDEYLHGRLVVPYPDRADVIARHIRQALDERAGIIARYMHYAPSYNARARESIRLFLHG